MVVAGANEWAFQDAAFLADIAVEVVVIAETEPPSAPRPLVTRVGNTDNVRVETGSRIVELDGEETLGSVTVERLDSGDRTTALADGLLVRRGREPNTEAFEGCPTLNQAGEVIADERFETDVPGVYAVGIFGKGRPGRLRPRSVTA